MISRRDFLWTGAAPLAGLFASQPPGRRIFLRMNGGAAHLDTWDPKPDAPAEIRGPFRAIPTNVGGIRISETLPLLARHADKYILVRSVYHSGETDHQTGLEKLPNEAKIAATCAHALRLVEQGEREVTVNIGGAAAWDTHGWGHFPTLTNWRTTVATAFDRDCSALLENLDQRGLLQSTLVIATGEFGRTPRINPQGGRDHWPHCWTVMLAGGGVQGGQVYGSSDATGAEPRDRPVSIQSLTALFT